MYVCKYSAAPSHARTPAHTQARGATPESFEGFVRVRYSPAGLCVCLCALSFSRDKEVEQRRPGRPAPGTGRRGSSYVVKIVRYRGAEWRLRLVRGATGWRVEANVVILTHEPEPSASLCVQSA